MESSARGDVLRHSLSFLPSSHGTGRISFSPQRQELISHTYNNGNKKQDMNWRHFGLQTITSVDELNAFD